MYSTRGNTFHTEIISCQYRKFTKFYKSIRNYSSYITKIKYEFFTPEYLNLSVTFDIDKSLSDIKKELESSISGNGYDCKIKIKGKQMKFSIFYIE